jgi:hypothetical protein
MEDLAVDNLREHYEVDEVATVATVSRFYTQKELDGADKAKRLFEVTDGLCIPDDPYTHHGA